MRQHDTWAQRAATASGWPVWREGVDQQNQPRLIATLPASTDLAPFLRAFACALGQKRDYTPPALTLSPSFTTDTVGDTVSLAITPAAGSTLQQTTTLLECWGPRVALWTLCREAALNAPPALLLSLASMPLRGKGAGLSIAESFSIANKIREISTQTRSYPTCAAMLKDRRLHREIRSVFAHLVPALEQELPPMRPDPKMTSFRPCYA